MSTSICRVCLGQGFLIDIFIQHTKLMSLAKVDITPEDHLPKTICTKCVQKLDDCIHFIELCEASDRKLRALLDNTSKGHKIDMDSAAITKENDNFISDNDATLSPKSEAENELFIDESIDRSIMDHTITDDFIENETKVQIKSATQPNTNSMKINKKQQCFTCGKVMSSRFRLKTHMRTHTGERPYTCPHCNKNFSLAQSLKVHLRVHTGEKPLKCSVCGEAFAQSAGLAAHKRKHSGILPYECKLCPRSFRTFGHLQYHTLRHTGEKNFECDTCSRAFITRSDLKQHLQSHSGDKPHVCSVCGKHLTRASHLKRHMQLAHQKNIYSWVHCPSEFMKKVELANHVKTHEGSKEDAKE